MEQNTQYLYEYQNGKRVRNLGLIKIERQMDKSAIQIYAKQMDEVKGILFQKANGEKYMGTWEGEALDVEERQSVPQAQPGTPQQPATPQVQPSTPQRPITQLTQPSAPTTQPIMSQQPAMSQPSIMSQMPSQRLVREDVVSEVVVEEEVDNYIHPRNTVYEKIQRQGLSRLPRKEWRLANNSFLLHGVYNYHHLLYIEEDGKKWIGVPGIYHEKEKMAANAFGFTEFRRLADVNIELEENERNTYEDFGYWCRQVAIS